MIKPILIANPSAGKRLYSLDSMQKAVERWVPTNTPLQVTQHPGHAEHIANEACRNGFDTLIVLGGDGTIHETLNGILASEARGVRMGIFPIGTANDYAFTLRNDRAEHEPFHRFVDIGKATCNGSHRYFINVAGLGLPGRVADLARGMKRLPARVRYTLALMRAMGAKYRTHPLIATSKEDTDLGIAPASKEYLMISVAIGMREGSYPLSPKAVLDDGLFEILEVGALRRRDIVRYFPRILKGDIPTSDQRISTSQRQDYLIECDHPVPFHLDGESFRVSGDSEAVPFDSTKRFRLHLEVLPRALAIELLG